MSKFHSLYDLNRGCRCPVVDCSGEPSVTKQSFKAECDINNIMSKYERTGLLDFVNSNEGRYGDASSQDYFEAMCLVADANSMFANLPAKMRARFKNDPAEFLAFVEDPKNDAEAIELGIKTVPVISVSEGSGGASKGATPSPSSSVPPTPPVDDSKGSGKAEPS